MMTDIEKRFNREEAWEAASAVSGEIMILNFQNPIKRFLNRKKLENHKKEYSIFHKYALGEIYQEHTIGDVIKQMKRDGIVGLDRYPNCPI